MTEHKPFIDFENLPAPTEGFLVTHFITVRSVAKSRAFYSDVLGGQVVMAENPCMIKLSNSWLIMNPGGGPTPDKPDVSVVNYEPGDTVSSFLNLRVADIQACYEQWRSKGAEFVTPPIDRGAEIRCYMRDPDGYMIEVGQSTGLLAASSRRSARKTYPVRGHRGVHCTTRPRCPQLIGRRRRGCTAERYPEGPGGGWRRTERGRDLPETQAWSMGATTVPQPLSATTRVGGLRRSHGTPVCAACVLPWGDATTGRAGLEGRSVNPWCLARWWALWRCGGGCGLCGVAAGVVGSAALPRGIGERQQRAFQGGRSLAAGLWATLMTKRTYMSRIVISVATWMVNRAPGVRLTIQVRARPGSILFVAAVDVRFAPRADAPWQNRRPPQRPNAGGQARAAIPEPTQSAPPRAPGGAKK